MRYHGSFRPVIVAASVLVLAAGSAAGQNTSPGPSGSPVLQGPAVHDNSAPGQRSTFGGSRGNGKGAERPIPQPVFMKAVMSLNEKEAPAATRLSAEQKKQIDSLTEEFRASQREFAAEHRDELRELAAKLPPEDRARLRELMTGPGAAQRPADGHGIRRLQGEGGRGEGDRREGGRGEDGRGEGKPGAGRGQTSDDAMMRGGDEPPDKPRDNRRDKPDERQVQAARDQLKALLEQAPRPEESRAKVWAVLTDAQRQAVEAELKKTREKAGERRPQAGPKNGPEGGKASKAGQAGEANAAPEETRVRERARERLKNMTPEQREEALKKLKERRAERGGERGRNGKGPADGRKPAPPIDEVNVPRPADGDSNNPK